MTVLFLEKVFLKHRKTAGALRGVELFNLNLIREMIELGAEVTVICENSWKEAIYSAMPDVKPEIVAKPQLFTPVACGLAGAFAVKRRNFDFLLIGNVGNTIAPVVSLLNKARCFRRMVLIAHRETSAKFLKAISKIPGHVVSVCGPIAKPFSEGGIAAESHVDYGIMNADSFYPRESSSWQNGGKVRFCVLGALDSAWKGSDTAIAAFNLLPADIRARAELHLKAFSDVSSFPKQDGIVAYGWESASTVPSFLRDMDVMIVPSRDENCMRETFSQATVQGMLTGLPVIYSDLPILKEKFDLGGGICFSTVEDLAKAMERLVLEESTRAEMGKIARRVALDRYVWQTGRFLKRYFEAGS